MNLLNTYWTINTRRISVDLDHVVECQTALEADEMTITVCKRESGNITVPVFEKGPLVIRERFMDEIRSRNS